MKIVLASNNMGKTKELSQLLIPLQFEIIPQATLHVEEVEEIGLSFIENALIKARHASRNTGLPAIADDSGLVVNALQGAPGIYSSRYAGRDGDTEANIKKLLSELGDVPDENRQAYFYCALVFMQHERDPTPLICQGAWHGFILRQPIGQQGFGYDPIFYVPEEKKSAAELPLEVKNKISHRGKAIQLLIDSLEKYHERTLR